MFERVGYTPLVIHASITITMSLYYLVRMLSLIKHINAGVIEIVINKFVYTYIAAYFMHGSSKYGFTLLLVCTHTLDHAARTPNQAAFNIWKLLNSVSATAGDGT